MNSKNLKFLLISVFVFSFSGIVSGQHKSWKQYTTNDGLLSNETFEMLQDKNNHLWITTAKGICRFNGYEFIQPVDTSAFVGTEAFSPTIDSDGRIWFTRLNQTLWFIEKDTIRAFPYNHIIRRFSKNTVVIDQLAIDEDGAVWTAIAGIGFLVITKNGEYRIIKPPRKPCFLTTLIGKKPIYLLYADRITLPGTVIEVFILNKNEFNSIDTYAFKWGDTYKSNVWQLEDGNLLLYYDFHLVTVSNNKITAKVRSEIIPEKIIQTEEGEVLISSHLSLPVGLYHYRSVEKMIQRNGSNLLPGEPVTSVWIDHEGGWWCTMKLNGLRYCKNPDIEIYDKQSGFKSSNTWRVAYDHNQHIYVGVKQNELWKINTIVSSVTKLPASRHKSGEIFDLYYDPVRKFLFKSSPLEYLKNGNWISITDTLTGLPIILPSKDITTDPSGNKLWLSFSHGISEYEIDKGVLSDYRRIIDTTENFRRSFSVTQDYKGNIWVATINGLQLWKYDHFEKPFEHTALRFQSRDLELMKDSSVAIAFLGSGILIIHPNGKLSHITTKEGLSTNFIDQIYGDTNGDLYACTASGLNRIFKNNKDEWEVITITKKQGLPSNLVNDVVSTGKDLWVATTEGLVRIHKRFPVRNATVPVMENMLVNNDPVNFIHGMRFPYNQNNIAIQFHSLHFRSEGDIQYRYRLPENDTSYVYTKTRQVNFSSLRPGKYTIEVQAQNENSEWTAPATWSFIINRPWWTSWWFLTILAFVIISGLLIITYLRFAAIKRQSATVTKLKDLEMAALRAQMNPHFIFNCLGSIQQFINENDKDSANKYLSRFAKLIRLSLHSSIDGKHSLQEEVAMLDNYLALEQMRFKDKFTYNIHVEDGINSEEIFLPPMLVQPYVENSLMHGIKNLNKKGDIRVSFTRDQDGLKISVQDNGRGFNHKEEKNSKERRSVGMSLTKRRLDILSEDKQEQNFEFINIVNTEGTTEGALVNIRIPIV